MSKKPGISVIVTSYNYGKYIDETIASVKNQTFKDFELIVIDDCSTDKLTKEKIEKISQDASITLFRNSENKGVVYSRNYATKKARADNILYVDSDDRISKDCLQKMYSKIDKYDVVGSRVQEFGDSKKTTSREVFSKYIFCFKCTICCSSLFKKSFWEKAGGFNENMKNGIEDYDFWLSMIESGAKFTILKDVLIHYRVKKDSRNILANTHANALSINIINNHPRLFGWFVRQTKFKMKKHRRLMRILYVSLLLNIFFTFYLVIYSI